MTPEQATQLVTSVQDLQEQISALGMLQARTNWWLEVIALVLLCVVAFVAWSASRR